MLLARYRAHHSLSCKQSLHHVFLYDLNSEVRILTLDLNEYDKRWEVFFNVYN